MPVPSSVGSDARGLAMIRLAVDMEVLPAKARAWLEPGDRLRIETPGGGGSGRKG